MQINFQLKNEKAEKTSIRLIITHRGKVYRNGVGISVSPAKWKKPKRGRQGATDTIIDTKLRQIALQLEGRLTEFSTEAEILAAIAEVLGKDGGRPVKKERGEGVPTFWQFFRQWSEEDCAATRQRKSTYRIIGEMMGKRDNWNDIDSAYYLKLIDKMDGRGYSVNYKGTIIAKLRAVMNKGYMLKYHTNAEYKQFKKVQEPSENIYLTRGEMDTLWRLKLTGTMESKARDLFVLGVYTAARFSDYSRLKAEDISNGKIRFFQKKTSGEVVIPASPRVVEVLKRNGGCAPKLSQQVFNRAIKEVCRKAGLTEGVQVSRSRGASHYTERIPKCDLVSSHTARRTGATLLYMSGVPLRQCMLITGHTTEDSFMKYIKITKEQNADLLASNPFFNQAL